MSAKKLTVLFRYADEMGFGTEENRAQVTKIIKDDTGSDVWSSTRNIPPTNFLQLSEKAVEELRAVEGVTVLHAEEEEGE
ncbi:uncharacterized protein BP01DRAFT_389338 [Aspergillus saccharolyticus JOP 1030-1]|uniref:Uncharacterized protein n=1 Tax=Aspergillus saccharolyticus JOP 1030-1 TaxID=1450539 RepID=A0A319AN82_9EURO|nr:hypothetical protein BP01DRAFT_389338 [Aspergillus saccharolyticus JOP 1030-1]PYH48022.1 hypothetical protein BP01DRAFT_389338 [Aspergillus saccharolyticus JOP 1030-1]